MAGNLSISKYVCPLLIIVGTLIVYWAPWMTAQSTELIFLSLSVSLRDLLSEALPQTLWFWFSVFGIAGVAVAGFSSDIVVTRGLTKIGGFIYLAFPSRTLWQILVEEADGVSVSPGWGLWASLLLGIGVIILSSRIAEE